MRPQMMRPSELLRMIYQDCRDETHAIYPTYLEPYKDAKTGRPMFRGVVTANVNAIIAVACYQEREMSSPYYMGGRTVFLDVASVKDDECYIPEAAIYPRSWLIAGGV